MSIEQVTKCARPADQVSLDPVLFNEAVNPVEPFETQDAIYVPFICDCWIKSTTLASEYLLNQQHPVFPRDFLRQQVFLSRNSIITLMTDQACIAEQEADCATKELFRAAEVLRPKVRVEQESGKRFDEDFIRGPN